MKTSQYLAQALLALAPWAEAAAFPEPVALPEPQNGGVSSVCTANLLYRILLPLSTNSAALAFCTSRFPVTATSTATTTSVTTLTTTTTTVVREYKRQATGTGSTASRTTPALLATLQSYASNVARTACGCIAQPVTTVTVRPLFHSCCHFSVSLTSH